jgi:hypothetical protein
MWWTIGRVFIAAVTIVAVSTIGQRLPRIGALLLSLPLISIIAFVMSWTEHRDLPAVSRLAKETLVLVPLGLPFFVPLAFAQRWGLGFWSSFALGVLFASLTIGAWLLWAPRIN